MEKVADGWHIAKTDANVDRVGNMIFDCINAAIACIPWGSFATLQPLPDTSWSQDPSFSLIAPAAVVMSQDRPDSVAPPQAAASSTDVGTAIADANEEA